MKKLFTLFAVAAMAFAANAAELTICDGEYYSPSVPIYGLWCDTEGTVGQMIYPADMLEDMVGMEITNVKFYTTAYYYNTYGDPSYIGSSDLINFEGATIQLSLMVVDQTGFDGLMEGATVVATTVPEIGDDNMAFELNEPFVYEGGNLLIECKVIETIGDYGTTYFYGAGDGLEGTNCCYYGYEGYSGWQEAMFDFLPMVTFNYQEGGVTPPEPPTPTEKTGAPVFNGYTDDGIHAYMVEILPTEPSVIYYRIQYPDGTWTEWAEYEEILSFTGDGKYRVEAYAVAENKLPSEEIAYEFVVSPVVGIDEMMSGKTISNVRYFNMAGQEMTEANGMTIVVTTYTDGTTSAVKVMK